MAAAESVLTGNMPLDDQHVATAHDLPAPFQDRAPRRWPKTAGLLASSTAIAIGFALALIYAR